MKKKTLPSLPPIPDKKFFKIGEVTELTGMRADILRYWESEISQLKPIRRGIQRRYRQQDIRLIRTIRELRYKKGLTIEGVKMALREMKDTGETAESYDVTAQPREEPDDSGAADVLDIRFGEDLLKRLKEIKEFLRNK